MDLDEIKAECARLSMWAHIATVPERAVRLKAYGMGGRATWRTS